MDSKVQKLIKTSKEVIRDCALENGAIVAANSTKPYYPRDAKNYFYVWPRDAAFTCVAAQIVGINDIQEPFFQWLTERPEDFKKEGLLFANYSPNGRIQVDQFQPDQAGTVLWAMHEFYKKHTRNLSQHEKLIRRLTDGLGNEWKEKFFFRNSSDLWEESHRMTSTAMENNHVYSLAACARGLMCSDAITNCKRCQEVAQQMIEQIHEAYLPKHKAFVRNHGQINDLNMDASLLGLAWPFEIIDAKDARMIRTVKKMEETIVIDGGVHRYQFDYYDGHGSAQEGAGAWPVLNFWMSIYWSIRKNKTKAKKYYDWVVRRIDADGLIPEQLFDDFRKGIKPLAWSHAMFIIASKYLGYV